MPSQKGKGKMQDPIANIIERIEDALRKPDHQKYENRLKRDLESALERSGLSDDELFSKYIAPRMEQTTYLLEKAVAKTDKILSSWFDIRRTIESPPTKSI